MYVTEREVRYYLDQKGKSPFIEWKESLGDKKAQQIIDARITRVQKGLWGDSKPVGGGINELRIDFGPGYRIYYGIDGPVIVVLLVGGTKASQNKDIKTAHQFWTDYFRRKSK